jgi:hypothetical protein
MAGLILESLKQGDSNELYSSGILYVRFIFGRSTLCCCTRPRQIADCKNARQISSVKLNVSISVYTFLTKVHASFLAQVFARLG